MPAPLSWSVSSLGLAWLAAALLVVPGCGPKDDKLRVTGLDPTSGDAAGGSRVEVKGENFKKGTHGVRVYFGDEPGTFLRIVDDETILIEAPGGKAGSTVDVLIIFEPGGEITIPRGFTFKERGPLSAP